ncbi:hypothetical protein ACFQ6S_12030 [Streptomyces sp. NPDC056479]|uniref:hypothetical protein n=1 Tax=Streptomyces sp. NPDC056479 TaxID=3345832 RepID=UPI003696B25C
MVGRRQRREIRTAGRTVPGHYGVAQGEYDAEDDAEHGDATEAPHAGGTSVGTAVGAAVGAAVGTAVGAVVLAEGDGRLADRAPTAS